ncbi:hypothetical protein POJ06DRAFT_243764 [Lipomyces tetrasporus]|uniref:HIT-type domain-containing protein n=1 Tax=Lipomyces tetrasporus TaxID=54092 RepID=A0AAD7R1M6_9ASCO|nr:uncharacterized protein POJ06DRAFT_243764 [Lipomyces tetrasporus]KAJ8104162.1 hypothetical protein POJ06DRAFT_243764 [Lipomyces tetrasporus]
MPLVELVQKVTASSTAPGRKKGPIRQSNSAAIQRTINRRLADLERENYNEGVKIEVPKAEGARSSGKTPAVRRILASKKNISNLFDEDETGTREFYSAAVEPSRYPTRHLCSVCGYWGSITCIRCGARYCSLACEDTHRETRCLKVYA